MCDVPFGEAAGWAEAFILGFPECLEADMMCYYQVVDGVTATRKQIEQLVE